MDPTDWPLWLKLMAGWGPLGLWAASAEWRAKKSETAHHETRTLHEEQVENTRREQEEARVAREERHGREIAAVTDRLIRVVERQSVQAHKLADGVARKIAEAQKEDETS